MAQIRRGTKLCLRSMRPRATLASQFIRPFREKSDVTLGREGESIFWGGQSLFNSRHGAINNQRRRRGPPNLLFLIVGLVFSPRWPKGEGG